MKYIYKSKRRPIDIRYDLVSKRPNNIIKTVVYDAETNDLIYERNDTVSDKKPVILKLPLTGRKIIIESFTKAFGRKKQWVDDSFEVNPIVMPLKTYNVDMGSGDKEYMDFIKKFVVALPNLPADGQMRRSPSGKFKIILRDKLKSRDGKVVATPCMIGTETGIIEVGKAYFMTMTQNERIAVLSHEYGHFYKNPLSGRAVDDEEAADLNGMTIYLGSGFGQSEYIRAFSTVFEHADSQENRKRAEVIDGFAKKILNGEYFGKPYNL